MADLLRIKHILDSQEGKELKEFLLINLLTLKSVDNIEEKSSATQTALELKAHKLAYSILVNVYNQIMAWTDADLPPPNQMNDWGV